MALKVGDKLPNFSAKDSDGNHFEIQNYIGEKALVIYFYPKDDTPGCTAQACSFRDSYEDFKENGAEVIGISSDSIQSHQKFASKYKLPFILLSDEDASIRKMFGVPKDYLGLVPGRATYVVDKKGIVQFVFDSTNAKIHVQKSLEILKKNLFYPLQFDPIFKERIWGGTKLKTFLNKPITSDFTGESWEISTVENDVSIVSNGTFEGKSLNEIIDQYPEELLGKKVFQKFGKQFPLLFKFLDAREYLSIQVHPNDELAQKRHNSFGKTEMWYVMQADEDARLIVGFKDNSSKEEYCKHLEDNSLLSLLDSKKVSEGDVFFLETGTVHAIGAGTVIAEIQQTSDITYRIYDFDRVGADGNKRELHVDLALDAINYHKGNAQKNYTKKVNNSNELVQCAYFTTNIIPLNGTIEISKTNESFVVYMCVEGAFELNRHNENYKFQKGDTVLLPAFLTDFQIKGKASLLEIYIS